MAKNRNAKKVRKNRGGRQQAATSVPRSVSIRSSPLNDPRVRAWDQLLRDPCASNLTAPCYGGMDSGYLVRTTDVITPVAAGAGMTVGSVVPCSFVLSYIPTAWSGVANNAAYLTTAGFAPGGADPAAIVVSSAGSSIGFVQNFITSNAAVKRARPVAACVKWMPSGPYTSRQGFVCMGYSPGSQFVVGDSVTYANLASNSQYLCSNGSEPHEVRWLPTAADENFTNNTQTNYSGGTVTIVLRAVDGTATSATAATLNGSFEVTTVWEWEPITGVGGVAQAPRAPLPYTSQAVLSTISDLGAYIFQGVRTGAAYAADAAISGVIRGSSKAAMKLLTGGVGQMAVRGAPMMLMA